MKNYYYNQKGGELAIYDTETKELLLLERIVGLRVFTSSELENPKNGGDSVLGSTDFNEGRRPVRQWGGRLPRAKKGVKKCGYCHKTDHRGKDCPNKPGPKKKEPTAKRTTTCKNCGEKGHIAKTCKNAPRSAPPQLPESEIQEIVKEERQIET